jgi:steroid 5-alpha reductase family enzyme
MNNRYWERGWTKTMIEDYGWFLLAGWLGVSLMMLALWAHQRSTKDASAVDVGWAAGLGLLAIFYAIFAPGDPGRRLLIGFLAGFWSFRLASYLLTHRVIGKEEDGRYQTLRTRWGDRAQWNFFIFYQAQGFLDVVLSLPFLVISFNRSPSFHPLELAGVALWTVAIIGETIADRQLAAFRSSSANQGKTCRSGLWRYSRHPNYFFEWLIWCAYGLIALTAPHGWLGFASPMIMLFFILKITGIPPTEERALESRGDDFRDYQRTTSAFVPWFPKRSRS